jgi:hypothetical protein
VRPLVAGEVVRRVLGVGRAIGANPSPVVVDQVEVEIMPVRKQPSAILALDQVVMDKRREVVSVIRRAQVVGDVGEAVGGGGVDASHVLLSVSGEKFALSELTVNNNRSDIPNGPRTGRKRQKCKRKPEGILGCPGSLYARRLRRNFRRDRAGRSVSHSPDQKRLVGV